MRTAFRIPAAGLLTVLSAAAGVWLFSRWQLAGHGENVARGLAERTLYLSISLLPASADPFRQYTREQANVLSQVYEGLVTTNPLTQRIQPGLASSWTVSADGLVYEFQLRSGLRWSDGTPLGPEDFIRAARRSLTTPLLARRVAFAAVRGAEAVSAGREPDEPFGVEAIGPDRLRITLVRAVPDFLAELVRGAGWPLPEGYVSDLPADALPRQRFCGPFTVEAAGVESVTLRRNPHYWNPAEPWLERVVFLPSTGDALIEEARFAHGGVHVSDRFIGVSRQEIAARWQVPVQDTWSTGFLVFNTRHPPFDRTEVRRALADGIDYDRVAAARGDHPAGDPPAIVPPLLPDYPRVRSLNPNSVTLPDGLRETPLVINFYIGEEVLRIAAAVARSWNSRLELDARAMRSPPVLANRDTVPAIWIGEMTSRELDPANFLTAFLSDRDTLQTGWRNADFDALLRRALAEPPGPERRRLALAAEEILLAEAPVVPLFNGRITQLVHPRVSGLEFNPLNFLVLNRVRFTP